MPDSIRLGALSEAQGRDQAPHGTRSLRQRSLLCRLEQRENVRYPQHIGHRLSGIIGSARIQPTPSFVIHTVSCAVTNVVGGKRLPRRRMCLAEAICSLGRRTRLPTLHPLPQTPKSKGIRLETVANSVEQSFDRPGANPAQFNGMPSDTDVTPSDGISVTKALLHRKSPPANLQRRHPALSPII